MFGLSPLPSYYDDTELGRIWLRRNSRAKRFVCRKDALDRWVLTVPSGFTIRHVAEALDRMREGLRRLQTKHEANAVRTSFAPDSSINCASVRLRVGASRVKILRLMARIEGMVAFVTIEVPMDTDFSQESVQMQLMRAAEAGLRFGAKRLLLPRVVEMASRFDLLARLNRVAIHRSTSRWGSCSSKGNINLSLFCLLLPVELQDYVIKHELAHLLHMDHSKAFWAQLDEFCEGRARELDKAVNKYKLDIRAYLATNSA